MKDDDIDRIDAVHSLGFHNFHGAGVESSPFIFPDGETPPSDAEIDAEIIRLQAEYDAQEYARKRQAEYPSIADLVVALYDTDDKSAVEAKRAEVKAKYPKPE
jgi:hypothetical protein